MLTIYGTTQCPDTRDCLAACGAKGVAYDFRDLSELGNLKTFLAIRDNDPLYGPVKAAGGVGIPLIEKADGTRTLDWETAI